MQTDRSLPGCDDYSPFRNVIADLRNEVLDIIDRLLISVNSLSNDSGIRYLQISDIARSVIV